MPEGIISPVSSRQDLELEPCDIEVLAYIHANKFITTKLFRYKFHRQHSYKTAYLHLRRIEEAGWLLKTQRLPNEDTFFFLTRPAIHYLHSIGRILVSPEVRSPHINPNEREHDKRVIDMRIEIETDPALEDLIWLSDHEMRRGLRMEWKRELERGRGLDLEPLKFRRSYRRTPDGHFITLIGGVQYSFVFEYEHNPYTRSKIEDMIQNLDCDFPDSYRLVVSRDKDQAVRLMHGVYHLIKHNLLKLPIWGFSFYQQVIDQDFTSVRWANLEGNYLPFVDLKEQSEAPKPTVTEAVNP